MVTKRTSAKKPPHRGPPRPGNNPSNPFKGTFWEDLVEIGYRIPDEELAKHPDDGVQNLKHYLYGHPKKN